jgi:flagellar L-ring protein precursor FlgH
MRPLLRATGLVATLALGGCLGSPTEFMQEPNLSPVGSGIVGLDGRIGEPVALASQNFGPDGRPPSESLYTDQRSARIGDIITVVIAINDSASIGNSSGRSQTTKDGVAIDFGFSTNSSSSLPTVTSDLSSNSSSQGQGTIARSEQIQVSVAAVVTRVLPNGYLMVSGSQEVRVNYELRRLTVAGFVRPSDISHNNTISYDRIAEARISYGGRGRLNDVQQPAWGQQLYDNVRPF